MLEDYEEARRYAEMALAKNPANERAYALIAQTYANTEDLSNIITKIPEVHRTMPDVAYALGIIAKKKGTLFEAQKWLEIAVKNDSKGWPDLRGALGSVLFIIVDQNEAVTWVNQLSDVDIQRLKQSIELLSSAWERICKTDSAPLRLVWLFHRAHAKRILGDIKGAIKDIDLALSVSPTTKGLF